MPTPNPNRKPFPRRTYLGSVLDAGLKESIHPLERSALEPHFKAVDPASWLHSLGAADVFLDNLGMLMGEQFEDHEEREKYFRAARESMELYSLATNLVLPKAPWRGSYLLGKSRRANAGEPRPVLRLLTEHGLTLNEGAEFWGSLSQPDTLAPTYPDIYRYSNIPWHDLLPPDWQPSPDRPFESEFSTGVTLPDDFKKEVPSNRLLHPREATPDLPLRTGFLTKDKDLYDRIVLDQGQHLTCVAHAVASGLTIAAHRAGRRRTVPDGFSRAWVHYASAKEGQSWEHGRSLASAIDAVRHLLPCLERSFSYPAPHEGGEWRTPARSAEAHKLTEQLGRPIVQRLNPAEISKIKVLLAAGWVVVVSTAFPKRWRAVSLNRYGLPMLPLPGDEREDSGHAWLLVGYDHIDGQQQWKYQGRFWCLNSWGRDWPSGGIWGGGICSLPFSFLLTEGIEAFGFRFSEVL